MATNLRLTAEAEEALREASVRTGRSQQEIIRAAIDTALGLDGKHSLDALRDAELRRRGLVPARVSFAECPHPVPLTPGSHTADLLDRDERLP